MTKNTQQLVQQGAVPVQQNAIPVQQGFIPVQQGAVPVQRGFIPVQQGPVPVQQGAAPVQYVQQPSQPQYMYMPGAQPGIQTTPYMVQFLSGSDRLDCCIKIPFPFPGPDSIPASWLPPTQLPWTA